MIETTTNYLHFNNESDYLVEKIVVYPSVIKYRVASPAYIPDTVKIDSFYLKSIPVKSSKVMAFNAETMYGNVNDGGFFQIKIILNSPIPKQLNLLWGGFSGFSGSVSSNELFISIQNNQAVGTTKK